MKPPLHYTPSEEGPTGELSWWKVVGALLGVGSLAPPVLWYLEIGPEMPWYAPLVLSAGLIVLGVGIYRGRGGGVFELFVKAAASRVDDE